MGQCSSGGWCSSETKEGSPTSKIPTTTNAKSSSATNALLMVDMSNEQVANLSTYQKRRVVDCVTKLAAIRDHWSLMLDSRLWLNNDEESTLSSVYPEWGAHLGVARSHGADLIPELKQDDDRWTFVEKKHYSSFVDSPRLLETLRTANVTDVYVVGINTNFCVFNTALDSFSRGRFRTYVVEEGVGSVSGDKGHKEGLRWIRAHLGPGAVVSMTSILNDESKKRDR